MPKRFLSDTLRDIIAIAGLVCAIIQLIPFLFSLPKSGDNSSSQRNFSLTQNNHSNKALSEELLFIIIVLAIMFLATLASVGIHYGPNWLKKLLSIFCLFAMVAEAYLTMFILVAFGEWLLDKIENKSQQRLLKSTFFAILLLVLSLLLYNKEDWDSDANWVVMALGLQIGAVLLTVMMLLIGITYITVVEFIERLREQT